MIPVTKTHLPNKEKFLRYVDQIYDSCHLTNYGPLAQLLEKRLADYLGVRNLILVANGTLALQVSYKALSISGSAITTPFGFPATTSSLVWESIEPIFADIDKKTWNINPDLIPKLIKPNTTAIVPVHSYGNSCEIEKIQEIAEKYNLKVIYDCAHAFGVNYNNQSILNYGDVSILSFHATKLFHTVEGGAIVTNDDELAAKIRLMINFGITGPEKIVSLGINAKLNEFEAAMGLCVLDEIDDILHARKIAWDFYHAHLPNNLTLQNRNKKSSNNYIYFPVLFKNEEMLKITQKKLNDKMIFPRRYFYPSLDTLSYINQKNQMSISRIIASRILCLPLYAGLAVNIIKTICETIEEACFDVIA